MLPLLSLIPTAVQIVGTLIGGGAATSVTAGIGQGILKTLASDEAGTVASKVIDAAKHIFGTDDPKQIELLIQQDKSKAELALKRMDKDLEEYRIQVDDTKDARGRDIELRRISGGTNRRANVMLVFAFTCLIVTLLAVVFYRKDIPDGVLALMNMTAGALLAMLTQAFNFEFGSSRSSGEKSDQLANMISRMR